MTILSTNNCVRNLIAWANKEDYLTMVTYYYYVYPIYAVHTNASKLLSYLLV